MEKSLTLSLLFFFFEETESNIYLYIRQIT
jgi:hypothetical protein